MIAKVLNMLQLPPEFEDTISSFSFCFRKRIWSRALLLLIGAVLCPGKRTVCNILRSLGMIWERGFYGYHRVLSRAKWSSRQLSRLLLDQLLNRFVGGTDQPLVFGIDETLERRWGAKIKKRGIYRDPVRSSHSSFVKCSGLRWMCVMLLVDLPWLSGLSWALPFLSVLCPSERYYTQARAAKKLTDWARQLILQLGRWTRGLGRKVYLLGDNTYATYELMHTGIDVGINLIVRMRLNARLFHFPPPRTKGRRGRKPKVGKRQLTLAKRVDDKRVKWSQAIFSQWYGRREKKMMFCSRIALWYKGGIEPVPLKWVLIKDPEGKFDPIAIACTDTQIQPQRMIALFLKRWRVEVTFAEVRRHLGVETQRQWSDLAIERSTPALMALFSIITLWADTLYKKGKLEIKQTIWYPKQHYSFSDAITAVRVHIYQYNYFLTSTSQPQTKKLKYNLSRIWQIIVSNVA